jgi:hypothetical protein
MAGATYCTLGAFQLDLAEDGKLAALLAGPHEILNFTEYEFDLGDGRAFRPMGWDECFPTIEPFGESPVMGDLIGNAPDTVMSVHSVSQIWRTNRYMAKREFASRGASVLEVRFSVENTGGAEIEFLWASHALFCVEGLLEVQLPDGSMLDDFSLDGTCRKYFVAAGEPVRMRRADMTLALDTDQPYWGVWLNRGGWPATKPAGFAALGIEATNAQADSPQGAKIAAGGRFQGRVRLEIMGGQTDGA